MASTSTDSAPATTTTYLQLCIQAGRSFTLAGDYVSYDTQSNLPAGGGRLPIMVETTLSISEMKQKIDEMTGIPPERQRWAVPPSGPITVENDGDDIGSVLKHKSTLHVQDCSLLADQAESQEPFAGHQWRTTTVDGTDLHQGDTIDPGFHGQVPQGRGTHMFGDTRSEDGALKQGDQYQPRNTFEHTQKQGEEYAVPNGGASAGSLQHRGNRYERTSTQNTNHIQGDTIQDGWRGPAPRNAGNHRFGVTISKGGSLHQGNKFGQSALAGDGTNTSANADEPSS
ncbi:hypothetical protein B0J15DRAFT_555915 [Fusarium solani]|uniref:Ubiquitin-like domain-containing protein n=1 Tax=Fusarium solani TaxID=169388 RepID=A0A9P9JST9_FUSSL|nr:uncharacterized protein B0J15DRAFT_555915 [Fusarium solani]KAH7230805.1 hypothetical protein B0J15DRAFT_555915 [Fusarium solani]